MIALLLRLHRPSKGAVRICGVNIGAYRLDDYRRQLAYVPQELALFGGTIRENIAFGKPNATDAEFMTADEFTLRLLDFRKRFGLGAKSSTSPVTAGR